MNTKIKSFIENKTKELFIRYVSENTEVTKDFSNNQKKPSSENQSIFLKKLFCEIETILPKNSSIKLSQSGFIYVSIPSNLSLEKIKNSTAITLLAHVDTAPDCSGDNVKPQIIQKYSGEEITFNDDLNLKLNPVNSPKLLDCLSETIITASGLTLLGADDKAGLAEIITLLYVIKEFPEISYPDLNLCITTDEEIGAGITKIDLSNLSKFCVTMDGGDINTLEYECFDAWSFQIDITGVAAHPGYAFNKMINASLIATEFVQMLPENERPSTTKEKEGFFHICNINAELEKATIYGLLRDFSSENNLKRQEFISKICNSLEDKYQGSKVKVIFKNQYQNMFQILKNYPEFIEICRNATKKMLANYSNEKYKNSLVLEKGIRGGTDGSLLSIKGHPCINLGSAQYNIHSRIEFTTVEKMAVCVEKIIYLLDELSKTNLEN